MRRPSAKLRTTPSISRGRIAMSVLTLSLGWSVLTAQTYPPPFPRDGATKLLENDRVVAWDVTWPKGHPTAMHKHAYDLVGAFLADGSRLITPLDKPPFPNTTKRGDAVFSPRNTIHIEEGTSDSPTRAILLELKEDGPRNEPSLPSAGAPPAFPREGAKQVLDNARVAVWDYTWKVGTAVPMHQHVHDAAIIWFENGTLKSTPQSGEPTMVKAAFGTLRYNTRGTVHTETLVEGGARAIIIELK